MTDELLVKLHTMIVEGCTVEELVNETRGKWGKWNLK